MTQTSSKLNLQDLNKSSSSLTEYNDVDQELFKNLPKMESDLSNKGETGLVSNLEKSSSKIIVESSTSTIEKKEYPLSTKIFYLALMGICGLMAPLASNMIIPALDKIAEEFNTDYSTATISILVYLIAIAICPQIWAIFSNSYGRKWFSVCSLIIFALGSIGCSFSTSIELLIAMRLLQASGSSASSVIGIGVISDIFPKNEMGRALGLCSIGPLLGPVLGPIVGGYMSENLGWRSIFYLSAGSGALLAILVALFYKETLDPSRILPAPVSRNNDTGKLELSKSLPNPFSCIISLKHVDVVLLCILSCLVFGSYFAITVTQPITVGKLHNLSVSQIGLTFTATSAGEIVGAAGTGIVSDYFVKRYTRMNNGRSYPPELRLKFSLAGSIIIIAALLMNGWFINYNFPLAAILFAQSLVGFSMTNIICSIFNYYVEAFPSKSSSVYACNTSLYIISGAISSVTTSRILEKIGAGYTYTFYAGLQILGLLIFISMIYFGPRIRSITRNSN